jgi:hypothetical protein
MRVEWLKSSGISPMYTWATQHELHNVRRRSFQFPIDGPGVALPKDHWNMCKIQAAYFQQEYFDGQESQPLLDSQA